jgi:hypothetical protein
MPNHQEQDHQSLMLHTEAIRRMKGDAALIDCALKILERWSGMENIPNPIFKEWERILLEHDWDTALAVSERGNQIRQSSPVSCTLPNDVRVEIMRLCHKGIL